MRIAQRLTSRLRNHLLQIAHRCGTTANPAGRLQWELAEHILMRKHKTVATRGGRSCLATAKKFLAVARVLVKTEAYYVPEHWLGAGIERFGITVVVASGLLWSYITVVYITVVVAR